LMWGEVRRMLFGQRCSALSERALEIGVRFEIKLHDMKQRFYRASAIAVVLIGVHGCKGKSSGSAGEGASGTAATGQPNPLAMLNGFEGEIGIALRDRSKNRGGVPEDVPILLQIKSDKVRAEIPQIASKPMPKGYAVLSAPEKKLSLVMDEQKQIVVIDLNQTGEQLKSFGAGLPAAAKEAQDKRPSKPPPKVTKTGVMDKVAGLSCENWEITEEARKVATVCIADQGASWFRLPITGIPTEYAWSLEVMDGKHFPLRAIGYDKTGAEQGRLEVTKLEKKPLPASLFEMPAGYKVVDLGAMMAQLSGLAGARPGAAGMPFGMPPAFSVKKRK
jgi:hypothetical protein